MDWIKKNWCTIVAGLAGLATGAFLIHDDDDDDGDGGGKKKKNKRGRK